jgi:hypothetical protein
MGKEQNKSKRRIFPTQVPFPHTDTTICRSIIDVLCAWSHTYLEDILKVLLWKTLPHVTYDNLTYCSGNSVAVPVYQYQYKGVLTMWDEWRVVALIEITAASGTRQARLLAAISRCRFKLPYSLKFVTDHLIFTDWLNYLSYIVFISLSFLYFYRSFFSPYFSSYFFNLISFSDFTFLPFFACIFPFSNCLFSYLVS